MKRTLPTQSLYPGISLYYDLRYGPEGEYNIVKRILEEEGLSNTDQAVSKALLVSQYIYQSLQRTCQAEVKELEDYADKQLIVGGVPVALVWLAHFLLKLGVQAKKAGTTLSATFKPKNNEDELITAVLRKLEQDTDAEEIIVRKISEISIKTKRKEKRRSRAQKRKNSG